MILVSNETLTRVLRTASRDITRPHLCGVKFERGSDGVTLAIGTDGHRMTVIAYRESEIDGSPLSSMPLPDEEAFVPSWMFEAAKAAFSPYPDALWVWNVLPLIDEDDVKPKRALSFAPQAAHTAAIRPFDKPVADETDKEQVERAKAARERTGREVSGKTLPIAFPPWRQLIPGTISDIEATINRKAVLAAMSKVTKEKIAKLKAATESTEPSNKGVVTFVFADGKVRINGDSESVGTYAGAVHTILHLQREYAEDAVKTMSGDFSMYLERPRTVDHVLDPVLFSDSHGARAVVMPRHA